MNNHEISFRIASHLAFVLWMGGSIICVIKYWYLPSRPFYASIKRLHDAYGRIGRHYSYWQDYRTRLRFIFRNYTWDIDTETNDDIRQAKIEVIESSRLMCKVLPKLILSLVFTNVFIVFLFLIGYLVTKAF